MKTDYKFWYIKRDDEGFITEVAARFFEGEYVAGIDTRHGLEGRPMDHYVRNARLKQTDLKHLKGKNKKDSNDNDVFVYTSSNFGRIKTDQELCSYLNTELAKDPDRDPIEDQK